MTYDDHLVSIANIASADDYIPPKILRFMLLASARELLPRERVADCFRKIVPTAQRVEIHKHTETHSAHYRNLLVCGRVWHCPVCAAKISESRRKELSSACKVWTGGLILVTYTLSHHSASPLETTLSRLLEAYRFFKAGRAFAAISEEFGWIGSVKSLEITHGKSGWHPHVHELVFTMNKLSEAENQSFEGNISKRWRISCKHVGTFASVERGVTVKTADTDVSDYVSKFGDTKVKRDWTFAHELTKQVVKRGKLEGRSPTQLLYDFMIGDIPSGRLWQEYAMTVKGRHQLVWSRGMRRTLKIGDEQSDEKLASTEPSDTTLLASLTRGQWYDVLFHNAIGELLQAAEAKDEEEFRAYLKGKLDQWSSS